MRGGVAGGEGGGGEGSGGEGSGGEGGGGEGALRRQHTRRTAPALCGVCVRRAHETRIMDCARLSPGRGDHVCVHGSAAERVHREEGAPAMF
jgi:hypothetical protein